jgi:hypothetical protein
LQLRGERLQPRFVRRAAAAGRGQDSDPMAARDLTLRKVEHVPKQAADRRAQHVKDLERGCGRHDRNQRSEAVPVSPGRSGYCSRMRIRTRDGKG